MLYTYREGPPPIPELRSAIDRTPPSEVVHCTRTRLLNKIREEKTRDYTHVKRKKCV